MPQVVISFTPEEVDEIMDDIWGHFGLRCSHEKFIEVFGTPKNKPLMIDIALYGHNDTEVRGRMINAITTYICGSDHEWPTYGTNKEIADQVYTFIKIAGPSKGFEIDEESFKDR